MGWSETLLRMVARLGMLVGFILGFGTLLSFGAMISARRLPPLDNVVAVLITLMVSEVALWCWWAANTLAHHDRVRASVDGIDRNPRRSF